MDGTPQYIVLQRADPGLYRVYSGTATEDPLENCIRLHVPLSDSAASEKASRLGMARLPSTGS